jgi:hypothetical protein
VEIEYRIRKPGGFLFLSNNKERIKDGKIKL